jgi:hypothetical protein
MGFKRKEKIKIQIKLECTVSVRRKENRQRFSSTCFISKFFKGYFTNENCTHIQRSLPNWNRKERLMNEK